MASCAINKSQSKNPEAQKSLKYHQKIIDINTSMWKKVWINLD
jgi:hypothetical protein